MTLLMALSWFWYGGDVERLGHRTYVVRAEAYSRLKKAGPWAVPALWAGRRNGNPERAMRIELILSQRASVWEKVIWSALSRKDVTDAQLQLVGALMAENPTLATMMYEAVDQTGGFSAENSERWARITPYCMGSLPGENAYVLKQVRGKLLFPQPVPVTTPDPDDCPPP